VKTILHSFCGRFLLSLFFLALALPAAAQDYSDEDLGFDGGEATEVPARDEVEVRVNGKPYQLQQEMVFEREQKMDLAVSYLKPWSKVHIEVRKAGSVLARQSYDANQAGQLQLEVTSGSQKVGGTVEIRYITSSGRAITRTFRILVR
ncbi:MAG: hypothetical protein ACK5PR_00825, partial [bacterium]